MAIALDRVRETFERLENGDGTAFFERVKHQRQPLNENLTAATVLALWNARRRTQRKRN
jgi:hypothetical protein